MSHLYLTNKKGFRIVIHRDTLKEAFPTADSKGSVCVLDVRKKKNDESHTFTVVNEQTTEIESQLKKIEAAEAVKYGKGGECGNTVAAKAGHISAGSH